MITRSFSRIRLLSRLFYRTSIFKGHINCIDRVIRPNKFLYAGQRHMSTKKQILEITSKTAGHLWSCYDTFLLDCDGVLWELDDKTPIPGIPEAIEKLHNHGKRILFVTNNSLLGRDEFANKFKQHGFTASVDEIFTVCYTAAYYLKHIAKTPGSVYAIGTSGMEYELKQMGFKYYGFGPETNQPTRDNEKLLNMTFHDDVSAVLVGFDEYFNYVKLYKAVSYLCDESCHFVATTNLVGKKGSPTLRQSTTAAMVEAVAVASKRRPVMMNKPNIHLFNCIKSKFPDVEVSRTLFIGDSVIADLGFAKTVGIDSALVLTGASDLDTVEENPGLEPTYLLKSLSVLAG